MHAERYLDRATAFVKGTGTSFDNFIDHRLVLEHMLGAERLPLTLLVLDAQCQVMGMSAAFRTRLDAVATPAPTG